MWEGVMLGVALVTVGEADKVFDPLAVIDALSVAD